MASFKDLQLEWSMLCQEDPEYWTESDLQLAAELGKTLLERNKELENALKRNQTIVDDQHQEIEYLTKQSVALREVNDSRLRIYEQLEVSIQDLERVNHRLVLDNSAEKKHIKNLTATIETLEVKNDELLSSIDDLRLQVDVLKKRNHRKSDVTSSSSSGLVVLRHVGNNRDETDTHVSPISSGLHKQQIECNTNTPNKKTDKPEPGRDITNMEEDEKESAVMEVSQLLTQLRESRTQCSREQRKTAELKEQLDTVLQQNQSLENQIIKLHHRDEDVKSLHEELNTLEEVRQGQMCSRCLCSVEKSSEDIPEDDDMSMLNELMNSSSQRRSSFTLEVQEHPENQSFPITKQSRNHYKELVEKYEALFENHRQPPRKDQFISLQEEMQLSGDFNTINTKDTDDESGHGDSLKMEKPNKLSRKTVSHTPTDFSETETSSSGFAEETSTKATQTDGMVGSFLCTIADGEDCKFSIYDDASPIDSRFRKRPEYRELFKEIFTVLKKAAENKDEGENLPLLDDFTPIKAIPQVPPVTPMDDSLVDFPDDDDSQSIISSTMSELSISQPTTVIENILQSQANEGVANVGTDTKTQGPTLRPLIRQSFDYISIETRKRSSSRRKNKNNDRSDSSVTHIIGSPKISYSNRPNSGRRKKDAKTVPQQEQDSAWNGNSLQFWSSARASNQSPTPSQGSEKAVYEFKPSVASQEIKKLKSLDKSYAEVLKLGEGRKREQRNRRK